MRNTTKRLLSFFIVFLFIVSNLFGSQPLIGYAEDVNFVYISDIPYESGTTGWGSIGIDKSVDGNPLTLLGEDGQPKQYAKGLGVHANSEIVYNVEDYYFKYFEAYVGVDLENASGPRTVIFRVYKDDELVFDSGVMNANTPEKYIKVDIEGAKKVKLVVNDAGDNINGDHGDWCDAKFIFLPGAQYRLRSVLLKLDKQWLAVGENAKVEVIGERVNGQKIDFKEEGTVVLSSSNEDVLTVDNEGNITAKADGVARILCEATLDEITKQASALVVVGKGDETSSWFIESPDKNLKVLVFENEGVINYTVFFDGKVVIENSPIGIKTSFEDFTEGLVFKAREDEEINETYPMVSGNRSEYVNHANQTTLTFTKGEKEIDIVFRAYDDGMAFRYVIDGEGEYTVDSEASGFRIPAGSTACAMPYTANYEGYYSFYPIEQLKQNSVMPLLVKTADGIWMLLAEAELYSTYSGAMLMPGADRLLKVVFVPQQTNKGPVNISLPFKSPWRAAIIGTPEEIAESMMIENLNPPSKIEDTSWIKPGVTSWTWLNGDPTNDKDTYLKYIDFSAEMGWEYVLLDEGWQPRVSGQWSYAGMYDWMDEVLEYAESKGVGLIVWSLYWDVAPPDNIKRLEEWANLGIKGIKVDFFDDESQERLATYDAIIEEAARLHLLVNFHGSNKPSGQRRTWPHLLTREGVRGAEFKSPQADQNCIFPFTRNVVGPMDYTPVIRNYNSSRWLTQAHMAAQHVIYESGIQCFADKPETYRASKLYYFLKDFPAAWDDTKVLEGYPGQYITTARKSGDNWYIGAICNDARVAEIPLDFLDDGTTYYATIYKDTTSINDVDVELIEVTKSDVLSVPLNMRGGCAIKIQKTKPSVIESITLDHNEITIDEKQTFQLNATVAPEDAEFKLINWQSDNEEVAIVENGKVTGLKAGTATITAMSIDGIAKATCKVTVVKTPELAEHWTVVNDNPINRRISRDGKLIIRSEAGDLWGTNNQSPPKNLVLTTPSTNDFTITTKLDFSPTQIYQSAGLVVYVDVDNYFTVLRRYHTGLGGNVIGLMNEVNGRATEQAVPDTISGPVYLKIVKSGQNLTSYYSVDNENWVQIGSTQTNSAIYNSPNVKVGVIAQNGGGSTAENIEAAFEDFTFNGEIIPFAAPLKEKSFIIEAFDLDRTAGIKAAANIVPTEEDHEGEEVVLFQLMKDTTPISIVAAGKDIISAEKFIAHFNVEDYEDLAYKVKVFVFDRFDSDVSAPVNLAEPVELQ